MDRQPQRGVPGRPCRARHAGRGLAGARCGGQVPGAQGCERRQSRRLHGGRGRRRADLSVRPLAGHGVSHPRDRAACRGRAHQHRTDRRHARAGLRRNGEHPGTPDRCGGAAPWLRSGRAAADQHGARKRHADDQQLRLPGRQRHLRRDIRPRARPCRSERLRRTAAAERGAGQAARPGLRLPHQGNRRLARRECRCAVRVRRHDLADHRHAAYRPGPRDDLPADPRPSSGRAERTHPAAPGRHRPDRGGRRTRQLARDLHGRHRDVARLRRDHRQGHSRLPPTRWRRPRPTSASRTAASSSPAPTAPSGFSRSRPSAGTRARRSTPITSGSAST